MSENNYTWIEVKNTGADGNVELNKASAYFYDEKVKMGIYLIYFSDCCTFSLQSIPPLHTIYPHSTLTYYGSENSRVLSLLRLVAQQIHCYTELIMEGLLF